jgi:hypothetical protein
MHLVEGSSSAAMDSECQCTGGAERLSIGNYCGNCCRTCCGKYCRRPSSDAHSHGRALMRVGPKARASGSARVKIGVHQYRRAHCALRAHYGWRAGASGLVWGSATLEGMSVAGCERSRACQMFVLAGFAPCGSRLFQKRFSWRGVRRRCPYAPNSNRGNRPGDLRAVQRALW